MVLSWHLIPTKVSSDVTTWSSDVIIHVLLCQVLIVYFYLIMPRTRSLISIRIVCFGTKDGYDYFSNLKIIEAFNWIVICLLRGFQAFQIWKYDFDQWVGVTAWTCTNNLRVVLGPCAQNCPCEASEQKNGSKTENCK